MFYTQPVNEKAYRLVTAPTAEPVSRDDVKTFLRLDGTADDTLIDVIISTARMMVEEHTKTALITQTWELTLDRFNNVDEFKPGFYVAPTNVNGTFINLSRGPVQSVTSIKSYNPANTSADFSSAAYTLDIPNSKILLNSGYAWPTDLRDKGAVKIVYVAGYGNNATSVPAIFIQAIKMCAVAIYENKGCGEMPDGAKMLLEPYRKAEAYGFV